MRLKEFIQLDKSPPKEQFMTFADFKVLQAHKKSMDDAIKASKEEDIPSHNGRSKIIINSVQMKHSLRMFESQDDVQEGRLEHHVGEDGYEETRQ